MRFENDEKVATVRWCAQEVERTTQKIFCGYKNFHPGSPGSQTSSQQDSEGKILLQSKAFKILTTEFLNVEEIVLLFECIKLRIVWMTSVKKFFRKPLFKEIEHKADNPET